MVASKRHPQDSSRINIHEPRDLQYWSDRWSVPRRQVVEAIRRVGNQVQNVAQALGKLLASSCL
jgi:hypothetical protein